MKKIINGKEYDYVLCPRCGVWVQSVSDHDCDRYLKGRGVRERAEKRLMDLI